MVKMAEANVLQPPAQEALEPEELGEAGRALPLAMEGAPPGTSGSRAVGG